MNPEIEVAQRLVEAVENGEEFSCETVLNCLTALNEEQAHVEKEEITKLWAQRFWRGYKSIGLGKLRSQVNDIPKLSETLYKEFGK